MAAGNLECSTELCLSTTEGGSPRSSITIFYGGRVCVCDVTEIQARAIISMARREMEETLGKRVETFSLWAELQPTIQQRDLQLLNPRMSMKKSLQRFLQKRKSRVCDNIHRGSVNTCYEAAPDSSSFS